MSPVSSMKTRCARRAFVFFYPDPRALDPGADLLLVALHGPALRPLGTPSQRMEQSSNVVNMVAYAELMANHFSDPWAGPQICVVSERLSTTV